MISFEKFRGETCPHCQGVGFLLSSELGKSLREARERKGISGRQMAAALSIRPEELSKLENGDRRIMPSLFKAYQAALKNGKVSKVQVSGGK